MTTLAPRQQITSAPLAIRSRIANLSENSNNSDSLGGFPASNYVQDGPTPDFLTTAIRCLRVRITFKIKIRFRKPQTSTSAAAAASAAISMSAAILPATGANVTNLNAGNITTGTLLAARGGTGLNASGASGNFLRSNGSIWTSAPLQSIDIPTGSGNYIQNSSVVQASSNFNVSGIGTVGGLFSANIVNSTTNFRIGGTTVFSTPNATSIVAGQLSNHSLLSSNNAFFGYKAGQSANNFSQANTFLGSEAGETTTSGGNNSFVGSNAGFFNFFRLIKLIFSEAARDKATRLLMPIRFSATKPDSAIRPERAIHFSAFKPDGEV